jgi:hypothetical protein
MTMSVQKERALFFKQLKSQSVTKAQFKAALSSSGKLAQFNNLVQSIAVSHPEFAYAWNDLDTVHRSSRLIAAIQAAGGFTDQQVDVFFSSAAAIQL